MSLQLFYPQLLFVTKKETHIGDQSWGERCGEGEAKIKKNPMVIVFVCYLCGFYWLLIPILQLLPVLQMKHLNQWGPFDIQYA